MRATGTHAREAERLLAALDRRAFLRGGAALAVAACLPGCGGASEGPGPPPELALRHLTPRSYRVLNAAAARIAGPRGAEQVVRGALDPARAAERFLAEAPTLAAPLRQALAVLEFAIWPLVPKLRPFTALAGPEQDAVLDALMRSRLETARLVFGGVRAVGLLGFYGAVSLQAPPGFALGRIPAGARIADAM